MAQAMTGGDTQKLFKMMEEGKLNPNEAIPKLAAIMKEQSDGYLREFQDKSLRYAQGFATNRQEAFMKNFVSGGGEAGMIQFWRTWGQIVEDSIGSADELGAAFSKVSDIFSGLLMVGPEFLQWVTGKDYEDNIFTKLFGKIGDSDYVAAAKETMDAMYDLGVVLVQRLSDLFSGFSTWFGDDWVNRLLKSFGEAMVEMQKGVGTLIRDLTTLLSINSWEGLKSLGEKKVTGLGEAVQSGQVGAKTSSPLINWILSWNSPDSVVPNTPSVMESNSKDSRVVTRNEIDVRMQITSDNNGDSVAIQNYMDQNGQSIINQILSGQMSQIPQGPQ